VTGIFKCIVFVPWMKLIYHNLNSEKRILIKRTKELQFKQSQILMKIEKYLYHSTYQKSGFSLLQTFNLQIQKLYPEFYPYAK